jgi:hypothetical protein
LIGGINLTYFGDVCLGPIVPLPTLEEEEAAVVVPEGASVFDMQDNALVDLVAWAADQLTAGGVLSSTLVRIANSTSTSALSEMLALDSDGNVDAVIPVGALLETLLGMELANDDIIPGLVVDAGTLRVRKVNLLVERLVLLQPLSSYVTRYALALDADAPLEVQLEASVQMAGDGSGAPIREDIDVAFRMTDFEFELELLTALDLDAVWALTLGHLISVDAATQSVGLTNYTFDCLVSIFFEAGLSIRELGVRVVTLDQLSVTSRSHQLLTAEMEALIADVVEVALSLYKDAVAPVVQNCVRVFVNDFVAQLWADAQCPTAAELAAAARADGAPPLPGLLRFASSQDWLWLQDLWQEYMVDDNFASLNTAIDGLIGGTFFDESTGSELLFADLPVLYDGTMTLGLSNVRVSVPEAVQELVLARALDPAREFDTTTRSAFGDAVAGGRRGVQRGRVAGHRVGPAQKFRLELELTGWSRRYCCG